MAVEQTNIKSTLAIKYLAGEDKDGKDIFKTQKFQKVLKEAKAEDVYAVGQAIGSLLDDPSVEIVREDSNLIVQC